MALRTALAVIYSSVCSGLVLAATSIIIDIVSAETATPFSDVNLFLFGGFTATLVITSTLGLAWHYYALSAGAARLWNYAIAGAAFGAIILWPIGEFYEALGGGGLEGWSASEWLTFYGAFLGAICASVGWSVRRPDRDANPPTTTS